MARPPARAESEGPDRRGESFLTTRNFDIRASSTVRTVATVPFGPRPMRSAHPERMQLASGPRVLRGSNGTPVTNCTQSGGDSRRLVEGLTFGITARSGPSMAGTVAHAVGHLPCGPLGSGALEAVDVRSRIAARSNRGPSVFARRHVVRDCERA